MSLKTMQPKVSIVMPARNEDPMVVAATIHGAIATTYDHGCEIILVDDGSDQPLEFEHPLVTVVRNPVSLGPAGARALGCKLAKGDVLAIVDAHMSFAPGWFEAFLPYVESGALLCSPWWDYRHTRVYCWGCDFTWNQVAGSNVVGFGYRGRLDKPKKKAPEIPMVIGACYVIQRQELERIGGYPPLFAGYGVEEQELSARAWLIGHGVRLITGARVGHLNREQDTRNGRIGKVPYLITATHLFHNQYALMRSLFEDETVALLSQYYEPLSDETALSLKGVDIEPWRRQVQAQRRRSDASFFRRFVPKIPLSFGKRGTRLRRGERPISAIVAEVAREEELLWNQLAQHAKLPSEDAQPPVTILSEGRSRIVRCKVLGVAIEIRMTNAKWLEPVLRVLPPHCEPHEEKRTDIACTVRGTSPRIDVDGQRLEDKHGPGLFEQLGTSISNAVIAHATDYVFVDASVVSVKGRAIVLLGDRSCGRFALQAELLRQGATYYSDAYAVFDADGNISPWARQPRTLPQLGLPGRSWPVPAVRANADDSPQRLHQVVVSQVYPGSRWRPKSSSPGEGLAALLNAVVARDSPGAEAFLALHAACSQSRGWEGERGSARPVAKFLLTKSEKP